MKITYLRSPESLGRPQAYINEQVINTLNTNGWSVVSHVPSVLPPENGKGFYHPDAIIDTFVQWLTALKEDLTTDVVMVSDAEMPIIPILNYIRLVNGYTFKIVAMFHSSCVTAGDFLFGTNSIKVEQSILACCDAVVVATEYLKNDLLKLDHDANHKIHVTGLPLPKEVTSEKGLTVKPVLVWPHRLTPDKGFDKLVNALPQLAEKFTVKILTPVDVDFKHDAAKVVVCPTRSDYYRELSHADICLSAATLETFGYAVLESVYAGCVPAVPNTACYPEVYKEPYVYSLDLLNSPEKFTDYLVTLCTLPKENPLKNTYLSLADTAALNIVNVCKLVTELK